jgi:hypothetical protein
MAEGGVTLDVNTLYQLLSITLSPDNDQRRAAEHALLEVCGVGSNDSAEKRMQRAAW